MANYTSVIASNICDVAGNKLAAGTVSFQATDGANQPFNFQVGGGGQVVTTPATATITSGAIAGGFQVADSANTSPAGILYRITITDTTLNRVVVTYSLVTVTGTTFNLDTYTPSGASVLPPTGGNINGPLTVTGNLSVTGSFNPGTLGNIVSTGSLTIGNIDNVFLVDGNKYPKTTAGLQAAINDASAAGGGKVLFPSGNITLTAPITMAANVHLDGLNTGTLTAPAGITPAIWVGTSSAPITDASVRNLIIVGPNVAVSSTSLGTAVVLDGSRLAATGNKITGFGWGIDNDISTGSTDCDISNNWIQICTQQGILGYWIRTKIVGNRIDQVGTTNQHQGIYISGGQGITVAANHISNTAGYSIQLSNGTASRPMEEVIIIGNDCVNPAIAGSAGAITATLSVVSGTNRKIVISNNTIEGLPASGIANTGIRIDGCRDFVVSGNQLRTLGASEGILVAGAVANSVNGEITGNTIDGNDAINGLHGVHIGNSGGGGVSDVIVANNVISAVAQAGIYLEGCTDILVSANRILNANVAGGWAGVIGFHGAVRNIIAGNRITTNAAAGPGLQFGSASEVDNIVFGNNLIGSGGYSDSGTRTQAFMNKLNATDTFISAPTTLGAVTANTTSIGGGTSLARYARYTPTLSPASVAANTTAEQTFTGVLTSGDIVVGVSKPTAQAGLGIVGWRASGTTLFIAFSNNTASPITPTASETYQIIGVQ